MDKKIFYQKGGIVMSKASKIWLIMATSLTAIGMILFIIAMSINDWDFSKLSAEEYYSTIYYIPEKFENINVNTKAADVSFMISSEDKVEVLVNEQEKVRHTVEVKGDTLTISVDDKRKWYEHIGISFETPEIIIFLPKEYLLSDVKIKTSTGDICAEAILVDSMDLTVSTGKITISNVECKGNISTEVFTGKVKVSHVICKNIYADGDTGDINLTSVLVEDMLSVKRDTGDVKFSRCDAGEIYMETDTGDITGSLLTYMEFYIETDTGDVKVPHDGEIEGGRCDLITDTGDIEISIVD